MKEWIHVFDRRVGNRVARLSAWIRPIMLFFTMLGEPAVTVGIAAVVLGYGLALSKPFYETAGIIALATIALGSILKFVPRRSRPHTDYSKNMRIKTFSFPSGHAAGAMVSYSLAAIAVSLRWPEMMILAWSVAIILVLLISLSRVYLGAHYASDVVGGWIVGFVGLIAILVNVK